MAVVVITSDDPKEIGMALINLGLDLRRQGKCKDQDILTEDGRKIGSITFPVDLRDATSPLDQKMARSS